MKCMINVPGRVGMEECSLDFFLIRNRPFVFSVFFWLGRGADFFHQLKLDFLDKVKGLILYFVAIKSIFYNCY